MASKKNSKTPKPELSELAYVDGDDIGVRYVDELREPEDKILTQRGRGDLRIYDAVLEDPQCYSTFGQRRAAVVSREWYIDAGAEDAPSQKAADSLREQLKAFPWDQVNRKMLKGVWSGRGIGELMLEPDGSQVRLVDVRVRKPHRFKFGRNGELRLIKRTNQSGIVMPEGKFWIFRAPSDDDDDPYGLGLGYYCYWPAWFKRNGARLWPMFLEHFSGPTAVAKFPPGSGQGFANRILELMKSVRSHGRLALPNNVQVELIQAMRSSGGDFQNFLRYWDSCISKIVLSQTMTTDDGSSQAQAREHTDVKLEVVKSDADLLCESFNSGPAKWLTEWNYPGATPPKVWRQFVEEEDLTEAVTRDKTLYDIGYEPTEAYVADKYGPNYRRRKEAASVPSERVEFAEPGADTIGPAADAVEAAIAGDEWRRLMTPEVERIEQIAKDAGSLEVFRERLGELAQANPDEVTESLARVMFAASVAGQAGVEIDPHGDD